MSHSIATGEPLGDVIRSGAPKSKKPGLTTR
jgi:hypothetical protein